MKYDVTNNSERFAINVESLINECFAFFILGSVFLLYMFLPGTQWNVSGRIFNVNFNLASYIIVVGLIAITLLIFSIVYCSIAKKKKYILAYKNKDKSLLYINLFFCVLLFFFGIYFFYHIYINENDLVANYGTRFLRHKVPTGYYFIFIFCLSLLLFFAAIKAQQRSKIFRITAILLFAFLNASLLFAPNFLADRGGGLFHINAYTNSIVNIAAGAALDDYNISIYGHYALFFMPFLGMFGKSYMTINIAICFFGFITFAALFYVLAKTIKNTYIFIFGCLSITGLQTMLYVTGQYYQANPHRLLFPALTVAFIVWNETTKQNNRLKIIIKYLLGILSLVWNFEMGLFTILTLFAYSICSDYVRCNSYKRICVDIAKNLFFMTVSIIGAIVVLNIFNLLHAGNILGIKRLIYPIGGEYGYGCNVDKLRLRLPNVYHIYVLQIMISLLALGYGFISRGLVCSDDSKAMHIIRMSIAVLGLCSLTYFMNRTAYSNISVSYPQIILSLALFADAALSECSRLANRRRQIIRRLTVQLPIGILCFLFLSVLAVESTLEFSTAFSSRADTTWKLDSLREFEKWTKANIPANTYAYGQGIPELYLNLGWDTQLHVIDMSDLNPTNGAYIFEQGKTTNLIFTNDANPQRDAQWVNKASYKAGRYTYWLFARKGSVYDSDNYMDYDTDKYMKITNK